VASRIQMHHGKPSARTLKTLQTNMVYHCSRRETLIQLLISCWSVLKFQGRRQGFTRGLLKSSKRNAFTWVYITTLTKKRQLKTIWRHTCQPHQQRKSHFCPVQLQRQQPRPSIWYAGLEVRCKPRKQAIITSCQNRPEQKDRITIEI